jgi:hypothetical protein
VNEVGKLIHLAGEKDQAEEDRAEQVLARALDLAFLQRTHSKRHEERRHQKDEGRERGELDAEDALHIRRSWRRVKPVDQMRRDQRAEEHAVRRKEGPHEELLVRNTGRRRMVVVVIDGAGVAAHG